MRHITDGELHAYLDGALDHLPGDRGEEVREHLRGCPTCRERLQDEETIRREADGLLEASAPAELPLPSFEEIRARALDPGREVGEPDSPTRFRGPLRGIPLAWAATVVLALGVGWMGGQVMRSGPAGDVQRAPVTEAGAPDAALNRMEPAVAETQDPSEGRGERGGAAMPETALAEAATPPAAAATPPLEEEGEGGMSEREKMSDPALLLQLQQRAVREEAAGAPSFAQAPPAPELARRREDVSEEVTGVQVGAAVPFSDVEDLLSFGNRELAPESSMLVPGLDVASVEWEEWVPGERALRIRQVLPMGDTLELRYLGLLMGAEPQTSDPAAEYRGRADAVEGLERPLSPKVLEASLPAGWNQVVMRFGRGWLVARAPLPTESLRGLLLSLR